MTPYTCLIRYDSGEITVTTRKPKRLLLDGDLIAYRTAASKEHAVHWGDGLWTLHTIESECQLAAKQYIEMVETKAALTEGVLIALSDKVNFRKELNPEYKANRAETRKPMGLNPLRDWLMSEYETVVLPRLEADDTMGILASDPESPYLIVSDDKDMLTIPSWHFIPDESLFKEINIAQANLRFYIQALTGDTTDNYKGVPNVGPKTAEKILMGANPLDDAEMWTRVLASYLKAGLTEEDAVMNARMARILRHGEYDIKASREILWVPPKV